MRPVDEHPDDLLGAYALGACTQPEVERVSEHLTACADCRATARRLGEGARTLLVDVPPAAPSAAGRARLMAQVYAEAALFDAARSGYDAPSTPAPERPSRSWHVSLPVRLPARAPVAALACGLALAAGAVLWAGGLGAGGPQTEVIAAQIPGKAPAASGTLELRKGQGELRVSGLPSPGRGRVYQVWLRENGEAPRPAGAVLKVGSKGAGRTRLPGDIRRFGQVLVTSEPAGGSSLPTRVPVLEVDTSA